MCITQEANYCQSQGHAQQGRWSRVLTAFVVRRLAEHDAVAARAVRVQSFDVRVCYVRNNNSNGITLHGGRLQFVLTRGLRLKGKDFSLSWPLP